jgi:hypothetical protein
MVIVFIFILCIRLYFLESRYIFAVYTTIMVIVTVAHHFQKPLDLV